ncbi:cation-transporting P-type ATPase [Nitrococcus mobilis]|uniref:Cation transport ATPase n=1 Tax=Nitrococcus mobilis Nb-231 TaxID=314278 RepID=A4BVE5_9GAMM|nr:cation-transporting P-type ATPase [Nitrococcus mobilis]EAR20330.1 Cation transport ATPase [Nitrococcus mobilis Nb-231]
MIRNVTDTNWHARSAKAVLSEFASDLGGLSQAEVERRLYQYGSNRLPAAPRRRPLKRFLIQFYNVLIYVLLAAGLVTLLLGEWVDSGVIFAVVLINTLVGFTQEGKAEQALAAIRDMVLPQATVLRDGQRVTVAAEALVPGDVVLQEPGDRVPADLRLLAARNLHIDEAALTGESAPVDKSIEPVAVDAMLGDRRCLAFSGTLVTTGHGRGVVVATGLTTELGQISGMLAEVPTLVTPLLQKLARFGRWLTALILIAAAATFTFGWWLRDYTLAELFMVAVGLAVAAIPEGLPAIITITLALGVQRMARHRAIVRRLPAVETLGSVTVICSDKTGTLTRNEMMVQAVAMADAVYQVSGSGYGGRGEFRCRDTQVEPAPHLVELARAALLCNDASLTRRGAQVQLSGDPMEAALVVLGEKAGLAPDQERRCGPRLDAIPFDTVHRFMATLHCTSAGEALILVKGAPERVLAMCEFQRGQGGEEPLDSVYWQTRIDAFARQGLRVLALAVRPVAPGRTELGFADVETGLTLLGLVGLIDPPREEAIAAVRACRAAGIRVKMITGDHAVTAAAIGQVMGIGDGRNYLTGSELDGLDETALSEAVANIDVFARVSPAHKLYLVRALQARGEVAAMTGDGVNDAPALKQADIGVAMGLKGTEVAKEAAEIVLADDNFASIERAVEEGRTIYNNLKKTILFILPTSAAEALVLIAAIALGTLLPITAVQILWVNMITAVTLALALTFEPAEADAMARPPRAVNEPLVTRYMAWRTAYVALLMVVGTFGLFLWERSQGTPIDTARTIAVNTLVLFEMFYLINSRYLTAPVLNRAGLTGNRIVLWAIALVVLFQLAFTYFGGMQALFGSAGLAATDWLRSVLVSGSVLVLVELEKLAMRRFGAGGSSRSTSISASQIDSS